MVAKSKKQNKFKNIILDLYYRLQALPMLFLLWLMLVAWKRRIEKTQMRLFKNRQSMDELWDLSNRLKPKEFNKQHRKFKKIEKDFLQLEEDLREDEERYQKQDELLKKYLGKVFDPTIGY